MMSVLPSTKTLYYLLLLPALIMFGFLFSQSVTLTLFLLFIVLAVVLLLYRPEFCAFGILLIVSGLIPYNRMPRIPVFGGAIYLTDFVFILSSIIVFLYVMRSPSTCQRVVRSHYFIPVMIFFGLATASFMRTVVGSADSAKTALNEFRPFFYLAASYLILNATVAKPVWIPRFIRFVVLLCAAVALVQLLESLFALNISAASVRQSDTEGGIKLLGIRRAIMPGISFVIFGLFYYLCKATVEKKRLIMNICLVLIMIAALAVTFGRMKIISVIAGLLIMAFIINKSKLPRYLIILAFMVSLASPFLIIKASSGPVYSIQGRLMSILDKKTYRAESLSWRHQENQDALSAIKTNPFFGLGLGAAYRAHATQTAEFELALTYVHNGYLFLVTKMGLLALFVFIWIVYKFFGIICFMLQSGLSNDISVMIASAVTFAALLISNFTQPEFHTGASMVLIAVILYISEHSARQ